MRRFAIPAAALAGLAFAVVPALADDQAVGTGDDPGDRRFTPDRVAVRPGEKVTIVNTGRGFHNVHWEDRALAEFPPSEEQWSTERTFDTPGEYRWVCDPHEGSGMRGRVFVNEAGTVPSGGGTSPTPTTTSTSPPPGGTTTETTPAPPPPGGTTTSTTTTTPPPSGDTTPPTVSRARARATRRGVRLVLTLSEPASVTVRVLRRARRVARRTFAVDERGRVSLRVRRALRRGRYSVRLTLVDAAGNRSKRTLSARVR